MEKYFVVYILYSRRFDKTYVGYTQDLIDRFYSHNFFATKGYTVCYRPWEVMPLEFFKTKKEAMARENIIKADWVEKKLKHLKQII